jgi:hypothetical protein
MRYLGWALLIWMGTAPAASAQGTSWLDKMFQGQTSHNFGSVPHGAQLHRRFPMTNIWAVPLEFTNVRVSCGCVTATPSTRVLQPRESGYLDITMDARRFTGPKTVTVYVTVGPQYTATSALQVSAHSRADIVFNPGQISFGVVPRGQTPVQVIDVEYAGVLDWRVHEVNRGSTPVDVTLEQLYREPGRVGYRLRTTLRADAPAGLLKQELVLKTNDPASPLVPVLVEAMIQAPLTVKPSLLKMGTLRVGDTVTRRVNVIGGKPFRILAIDGLGDGIHADIPQAAAQVQTLTFVVRPLQAGAVRRQFQIRTDLPGQGPVTVTIEGDAAAAAPAAAVP